MNEENPYQSPGSFSERLKAEQPGDDSPLEGLERSFALLTSCENLSEAIVYQGLLRQLGIDSHFENANAHGGGYSAPVGGIKVYVEASDLEEAVEYLASGLAKLPARENLGDITFECEECGKKITFPGDRRGMTETCPKCHEYIDVPE